jgi:uncharacterized protein YjbJ (UPF0337 family)
MKSSKTDKIEGAIHEAKGKVKEVTGKIIGNSNMRLMALDDEDLKPLWDSL